MAGPEGRLSPGPRSAQEGKAMSQSLASPTETPMAQAGEVLLEDLEPPPGGRALVIGHHRLDVLCGLIRQGCTQAAELCSHDRGGAGAESAQIVVLIDPASLEEAASLLATAWRALDHGGRILVRDPSGRRYQLEGLLRAQGFIAISARETPRGTIILGRRPFPLAHG